MKTLTLLLSFLLAASGAQALPTDAQGPLNLSARKAPANALTPADRAQRDAQGEPLEPLVLPYGAGYESRTQSSSGGAGSASSGGSGSGGNGGSGGGSGGGGGGGGRGGSGRGR